MNYKDFISRFDLDLNTRTVTIVLREDQVEQLSDAVAHVAGLIGNLSLNDVDKIKQKHINTYGAFGCALLSCRTAFDALKPKPTVVPPDTIEKAMAEIEAEFRKGGPGDDN